MSIRLLLLAVCLLIVALQSGCGFKDIDRRFFVVNMGIDVPENKAMKYRVTLKLAEPGGKIGAGKENFLLLTREARSVTEAIRLIKSEVDKELDFGHNKLILLGEGIAEHQVDGAMDWIIRRRDIQMIAWMAIGKPTAEAVLSLSISTERLSGNALMLSFGQTGVESGYIVSQHMFDFYRKHKELGIDPVLPIIQPRKQGYEINKAVIFNKGEAVLALSEDETRVFNVINGDIKKVEVGVPIDHDFIFASIDSISSRIRVRTPPGRNPYAEVSVEMSGVLEEASHKATQNKISVLEQAMESQAEARILRLLTKLQQHNVDPFGLGLDYRSRHFGSVEKEWQDWQRIYPQLEFDVKMKARLKGTGAVR